MDFETTCIGCGCNDNFACNGGCYWIRLDRTEGLGVCSECFSISTAWDNGDRTLSPEGETESDQNEGWGIANTY